MEQGDLAATPDEPVSHNKAIRKQVLLRRGRIPGVTQVARALLPAGDVAASHQHADMWELFICESGAGTMLVAGQPVELLPGRWVLVDPGEPHELKADRGQKLVVTTLGITH